MNAWAAKFFGSQETETNTTPPESRVVQSERVEEPETDPQIMVENGFRNLYKQEDTAAIKLLLRIGRSYLDSLEETKRSNSQPKAIGYPGYYNPSALLSKDRISHSAPPVNRRYDSLENSENNVTTVSRPPRPRYRYGSANHDVYEPVLDTYRTRKPKRSLSSTNPTDDERNAKRQKITKKTKAARNIFTVPPNDDMDLDQSLNEPKSKILQETKDDDEEMAVEPTPVKKLPPAKKPFVPSSNSTKPNFTLQKKTTSTLGDNKNSVPSFLTKGSKPLIMKSTTTEKPLSSSGGGMNFLKTTTNDTKLDLTTKKSGGLLLKLNENGGGKNEKPQSGLKLPFLSGSGTDKSDDGNKRKRKFSGESNDALKPIKKPKLGMTSLTKSQETKTSTVKPVAKQKPLSQESQKKKPQMSYAMKLIMEKQERIKKEYVKRISNIYKKHNPGKVDGVKDQVEKYMRAKKLHALYEKICKKYKVTAEKEYNEETSNIYQDEDDAEDTAGKSTKPKLTSKPIGGLSQTLKLGEKSSSSFKFTGLGSANKSKDGGLKLGKLGGIGGGGKFTLDKKTTEKKSGSEYKLGGLTNSTVDFTQGSTPKTENKEKEKKSSGSSNPFASIAGGLGNSQPKLNFELPKAGGGLNLSQKSESKPFSLTKNTSSSSGLKLPNFAKNNSGSGLSFSMNNAASNNNTNTNSNNSLTINTNINSKPPLGGGANASPFNIPKFNMGGGSSKNNNNLFSSGGGSSPFAQLNPSSGNNLTPAPSSNGGQFSAGAYKPKRRRR